MKTITLNFKTGILCVVLLFSSFSVIGQNPTNGGFESGSTGWTLTTTSPYTPSVVSTEQPRTGSNHLQINYSSGDGSNTKIGTVSSAINILTGQYCHIIGWAKMVGTVGTFAYGLSGAIAETPTPVTAPATTYTRYTRKSNSKSASNGTYQIVFRTKSLGGVSQMYFDDIVTYASTNATTDIVAPNTATGLTVTGNVLNWTEGTDANTGVQATYILRTTNASATVPVLSDQVAYAASNTVGDWTVIGTVNVGTTTYTDATGGSSYYYAVVHRDLAYNNSVAALESKIILNSNANISSLANCPTCDLEVNNGVELTINESRTYNNLVVAPGAKVTNDNATLTTLTLTNNLTLGSNAGNGTGTYVEKQNGALNVGGVTKVQQYLETATGGRNWFITSPVATATSNVVKNVILNKLWSYTEANTGTVLWNEITATDVPLTVMAGYVAKPDAAGVIEFVGGALNTGSKTSPALTNTGVVSTGYNLVGNPYPSYVNWDNATKTNVSTSIWYRSKSTGSYLFQTFNVAGVGMGANGGSELIPPMQSFWVKATGADASVSFDNSMRSHQDQSVSTNRLKAPVSINQKVLRLQVSNSLNTDEAVIYFNDNASNELDMYDSQKMWNNSIDLPEIYTQNGSEKLVINGMNSISYDTEIPIGFSTLTANDFSISANEISNFETGTKVILLDKLNPSVETELTNGTAYNFTAPVTTANADRFSLLFRAPGIATGVNTSSKLNAQVFVNADNQITIIAPEKSNYSIYNAVGQLLNNGKITTSRTIVNTISQAGVYIVKLTENGTELTTRVIIK